ncbi:Hypothetical predicted protein [Mytilus galloprovincialis]|uniref:EF-hand domain-containing protein n=1 Tax=Mytilus galloprovincialis TaxID=29158 RepID=A0A8B6D154_MYTGA|nr:Hypothetical predicted protein [Mytilus galloprovincialis]
MLLNLIRTIAVCLIVLLHLSEGCFRHDINERQSVHGTLESLGGYDYKVSVGLNHRFKRHAQDHQKFHVEIDYKGISGHDSPLDPCVFNPYDLDVKGYITEGDLEKIFVYFGDDVNKPEILHTFFTELDIDEDKMVTKEEFDLKKKDVITEESCSIIKDKDAMVAEQNMTLLK